MEAIGLKSICNIALIMLLWTCTATNLSATKLLVQQGKILTGHKKPQIMINKVSLTQKGYIQFLRYITHVPTIHDFTFCIWLRSHNLTYSHPLVSYSLHEETRLIRAWISPYGKTANLAIREHPVFKVPINLREGHWYHICQSWESKQGAWNFFLNGKLKAAGIEPKLRGIKIPPKGDLVVGQEYTDFDKGLDDGIEGDIFGFNFILAPATVHQNPFQGLDSSFEYDNSHRQTYFSRVNHNNPSYNFEDEDTSEKSHSYYVTEGDIQQDTTEETSQQHQSDSEEEEDVPSALGYFSNGANRDPKGLSTMFGGFFNFFEPSRPKIVRTRYHPQSFSHFSSGNIRQNYYHPHRIANRRIAYTQPHKIYHNDITGGAPSKPLGLVLVEVGYHNCALGKGAPIDDERVLVSWTKTPVRVFGGAILKSIPAFCL